MRIKFFLLAWILCTSISALAQSRTVSITAAQANLRGTATARGLVVITVNKGESFELIKQKGDWYLVQTRDYVGWLHRSVAIIDFTTAEIAELAGIKTYQPQSKSEIPFAREYVGPNYPPTIYIENNADRILTLDFANKRYQIIQDGAEVITVTPGTYEFIASAPRVRTLNGNHNFEQGYRYTWTFFIIRR